MYGEEWLERRTAIEAEEALRLAVVNFKVAADRGRVQHVLEWHALCASKGLHTGDTDHLGAACPDLNA